MSELQKYLQKTFKSITVGNYSFQKVRPLIICNDGESVSIQAGRFLYSIPREDGAKNYSAIEAGFPSVTPPSSWKKYAEEWNQITFKEWIKDSWNQLFGKYGWFSNKSILSSFMFKSTWKSFIRQAGTQTVYPYMPIEITQKFIDTHGGINWDKSLEEKAQ